MITGTSTSNRFSYEIGDDLSISAWDLKNTPEDGLPFLHQSHRPDGSDWASQEEVLAWLLATFEQMETPPHASWVLNEITGEWDPPVPYPTDGASYLWDDATTSWVAI